MNTMRGYVFQLAFLLVVASEFAPHVEAFSRGRPTTSCAFIGARNYRDSPFPRCIQRGQELLSTPPPLSSLSDKDDSSFDNYTPAEITKMKDVIESLSQESNDETRRLRLKAILEVGLAGPNGGPKRFAVLFDRVLTQVGEQFQREAREKFSERVPAEESTGDEIAETESVQEEKDEDPSEVKPKEKSPEELKLWALVDMMIQSKTTIKKHKF